MFASDSVINSLSWPQIVQVSKNIYAAKFDLMKFTPAKRILDEAMSTGKLRPGGEVIESSSGTFALALAILCSLYGLKLTLVTGPVSSIVRWRLENLGARIHVVHASHNCEGGIQQARLKVLHQLLKDRPGAFWTQQYTNPLNAQSYFDIAQWLSDSIPGISTVIGSVGSGGSLFGITKALQAKGKEIKVVAIDHNRSVIFGSTPKHITAMCRDTFEQLLAMGAGIPMGNVEFERCDSVHWVPVPMMIQQAHWFHAETGYLVGPSSGAALAVAKWEAAMQPEKPVLTILPDHGVRYTDTMFNPQWLERWRSDMQIRWEQPELIDSPRDVSPGWCRFQWDRRPFHAVLGVPPYRREAGFDPEPICAATI